MGALGRLFLVVFGATADDIVLEVDAVLEHLLEGQHLRLAVDDSEQNAPKVVCKEV